MTPYDATIDTPVERKEMFTMTGPGYPTPTVRASEILTDGTIKEYNLTGEEVSEILRKRGYERQQLLDAQQKLNSYNRLVVQLEENIKGWTDEESDAEDIISDLCDMFEISPVKEIPFTAMLEVSGYVRVPLNQVSDFDLEDVLDSAFYVDSNEQEVYINDFGISDVQEDS